MIVGPNRSTLGGHELVINTPELLAALAESVGWVVHELIPLEAYQRFDLHRQNSITTEKLILLKN
jgi:site-specific DNA-methyltransferase (cytosine-N4-specific)